MILKLKRTPGIYLVGFMGTGKSTVGRGLARQLGWRFADIDDDIESYAQMSITEIFDSKGEEEFRRIESEMLKRRVQDIARGIPWVVALGGGCFAQSNNFELIQNHGVSVWLDVPLDMIKARIGHCTHRPLARDPVRFEQLYNQRRGCYGMAHYHIQVGPEGSAGAVESIMKLPLF